MINTAKALQHDLFQLIGFGLALILSGIFVTVVLFISTEYSSLFYLPFGILGAISGSLFSRPGKGGYINYYLTKHTWTEDEKKLFDLIAKYQNKNLVIITAILFIISECIFFINNLAQKNNFSLNNILWLISWTFICTMTLCTGVKYVSAWWNIRNY